VKVLVIDDAADSRLYVRLLLERWGWEVLEAAEGQEGLTCIQNTDVRLVICDWMMPGLSGPELSRTVRAMDLGHYVYLILLTGRSDSTDLVEGLNSGADDFLTKPFEAQVLKARLRVGERILALEQRLADQNQALRDSRNQLALAYDQIQADLATAARIQRQLLPTSDQATFPFRAQWLFLPAAQVSGDSFNFFELAGGLIGFYHLDVSGHGIPAALLSVSLSRSLVPGAGLGMSPKSDFLDPGRFLADLNRQLLNFDGEVENYATIAYGTLDKASGKVRLALAGHPYPVLVRQAGTIEYLQQSGLPVGMFPEADYAPQEFCLGAGDRLVLYSDGVTDCRNPQGQPFGEEQLLSALDRASQMGLSLTSVLDDRLRAWRGPFDFEDDISLLVLERPLVAHYEVLAEHAQPESPVADQVHAGQALEGPGPVTAPPSSPSLVECPPGPEPGALVIRLSLNSDAAEVADLQECLTSLCAEAGLDEMANFKLTCAIVEALNNCVEHAYAGQPGHPIDLVWTLEADQIAIEIRDQGRPMPDPSLDASLLPGAEAESGRGWHIIREWTDSFSYAREAHGNLLRLTYRRP